MCLTGDGADELFASYRNIQNAAHEYYGQGSLVRKNTTDYQSDLDLFFKSSLQDSLPIRKQDAIYPLESEIEEFKRTTNVFNYSLSESQLHLLPDQVLLFSDHLGMAHGLEIRPPYLSKSIIEFSRKLPLEFLIDSKGTTKVILKELALKYFDDDFVKRKKEGFMLPLEEWMKTSEAKKWTKRKLSEYIDSPNELLDRKSISDFVEEFYLGSNGNFFKLYRLSTLMHFLKNHN